MGDVIKHRHADILLLSAGADCRAKLMSPLPLKACYPTRRGDGGIGNARHPQYGRCQGLLKVLEAQRSVWVSDTRCL